ncbi:MAG TPA: gliding motility protein GldN [Flavobacteriales bacterium]|nr:gliding motility protein GldN [Flavobacteriales bacterium]
MNSIMKGLGILMVIALFALPSGDAVAQADVLDGVYIPEHAPTRKVISYAPLREADVMWTQRIWRKIDLREKINHPLYYPDVPKSNFKSLFDVIKDGIIEGTITAYDPIDDEFKYPMTKDEVLEKLSQADTSMEEDFETGELVPIIITNEVLATDMRVYELKEDWFFDRQRSVQEARIIGISPQVAKYDESDNEIGKSPLFWLYYPQARYVFANQVVFNRQNDAERRTYEDILWKRMFNSYISKESNVYNRSIFDYTNGIAYQLESEKIKNGLFLLEHDLWSF